MNRGFIVKQRAFLKLYLISMIDKHKDYGWQYLEEIRDNFKSYGYNPTQSEVYRALHDLTEDGIVYRIKKVKGDPAKDFQEVVYYRFTEDGFEKALLYKKQMKVELDRCIGLLNKAVRDIY